MRLALSMRLSGVTTKAERKHMGRVAQLGCIVCRNYGHESPAAVHHLVEGHKRLGHMSTIPLCPRHHQITGSFWETIHGNKPRFEKAYGTERELLKQVEDLLSGASN